MKAVFDLDGTLVDSMRLWDNLANNYLLSIGIEPPKDLGETLEKLTLKEAAFYIKERFNIESSTNEIIQNMENILADYYSNRLRLKPYVLEILEKFKNKGVTMVIATATDEHLAEMLLNRHNIRDYFKFIQSTDSVGLSKGQVEFFQIIIDKLGSDSKEIWVFEDALYCMVSAKKAGLNIVAVEDKSSLSDLESIKKIADIYIEDFSQLEAGKLWKNY